MPHYCFANSKKRQKEGNIEAIVQKMLSIGKKIQNCIHKRKTEMEYSVQINANIDCDRGSSQFPATNANVEE